MEVTSKYPFVWLTALDLKFFPASVKENTEEWNDGPPEVVTTSGWPVAPTTSKKKTMSKNILFILSNVTNCISNLQVTGLTIFKF